MPLITPADQDTSLRLQRAIGTASLTPPNSVYTVVTPNGGNAFEVTTALKTAYDADLVAHPTAPAGPDCRVLNDCYTPACTSTLQAPNEFELPVQFSAKISVAGYHTTFTVSNGPPNGTYSFDWGDGLTVPMQLDGNGDWSATHVYGSPGTFTLGLSDDDGVVGTLPITVPSS